MQTILNNTNNYLSSLVGAGADAMSNLYYVQFIGGHIDNQTSVMLTVRNSEITFPTVSHPTDKKHFMTTSMDAPKAEINIEKRLSIRFRLDSDYQVYKFLLAQQAETSVPNLGYASNRIPDEANSNNGFKIIVYAPTTEISQFSQEAPEMLGTTAGYTKLYEFRYCWISDLTPPSYTYSSASPLTIGANIYFYEYDDPQSLLTGGING